MLRQAFLRASRVRYNPLLAVVGRTARGYGGLNLVATRADEGYGHYLFWTGFGAAVAAGATLTVCDSEVDPKGSTYEKGSVISNWSATHSCSPAKQYEPRSAQEICRILENHHATKTKIRPIGTALSPNGIGMSDGDVLSVSALDYVEVDKKRMLVTVGGGARVSDVLKELAKHDLTLENFSSIQEQQMAGWTQVAAHGTGRTLPTVDEMIVRMKLATPTEGLITLSDTLNPRLFRMAKVGLGSLGVVTELTLRCTPRHKLLEHHFVLPTSTLSYARHYERLAHFRHTRYVWFPYTDKVCVVVSNPTGPAEGGKVSDEVVKKERDLLSDANIANRVTVRTSPTAAMCNLLLSLQPGLDKKAVQAMTFAQLRDLLIGVNPLDTALVKRINAAEAEYWERSAGFRSDDSTNILGFDCGGAQWVMEVCFPIGAVEEQSGRDLQFVQRLLRLIEEHQLPAPCPIEQRWTARSTAPMSPAYSANPNEVFCWVGVIMYLPPNQTDAQRQAITEKFRQYVKLMQPLCDEFNAQCHWAKIEPPVGAEETAQMQQRLQRKYPVKEFNDFRNALDPHRILSNGLVEALFGK